MRVATFLLAGTLCACGGDAVEADLIVEYSESLGLTQLLVAADHEDEPVLEDVRVPEEPTPLVAERDGVRLILPDWLDGETVRFRVGGLANEQRVAEASEEAVVHARHVAQVILALEASCKKGRCRD